MVSWRRRPHTLVGAVVVVVVIFPGVHIAVVAIIVNIVVPISVVIGSAVVGIVTCVPVPIDVVVVVGRRWRYLVRRVLASDCGNRLRTK